MAESTRGRNVHRIGLISDTHGKLDQRVSGAFADVERILHAGDVGRPEVLWELQRIAPVCAVLGNVDRWDMPGEDLPIHARVEVAGVVVDVVHERHHLQPHADRRDVVVFGHSHMPLVDEVDGVLWVNPGSASQARRSPYGRSVAILHITGDGMRKAHIVPLAEYGEQQ